MRLQLQSVGLVTVGFGSGAMGAAFWRFPPTNSSEWASWVQAVGSVLAICAAIWIAWWQGREDRRHERARAQSEEQRLLANALKIGNEIALTVRAAFDHRMDPSLGDTPDHRARELRKLESAISAVSSIPLYLMPSTNAIGALMELRAVAGDAVTLIEGITGMRGGHPSYAAPFAHLANRALEQQTALVEALDLPI